MYSRYDNTDDVVCDDVTRDAKADSPPTARMFVAFSLIVSVVQASE